GVAKRVVGKPEREREQSVEVPPERSAARVPQVEGDADREQQGADYDQRARLVGRAGMAEHGGDEQLGGEERRSRDDREHEVEPDDREPRERGRHGDEREQKEPPLEPLERIERRRRARKDADQLLER